MFNKLIGSEEERAVSPVIGVILMVAITVILAAVIAAFVLDIGPGDSAAPNAQIEFDANPSYDPDGNGDGDEIVIGTFSHGGGDSVDPEEITVQIEHDGDTVELDAANDFEDNELGEDVAISDFNDGEFTVGSSADLTDEADDSDEAMNSNEDFDITIIHDPSDSIIYDETHTTADY